MKLLIVDNDRNQVEMLTGWLKTLGHEVRRAYSGERAKREWEEQQPDLIILDPVLKDIDALAMCREMRSKHDALILVVTEGKDVQDEVRCLDSGADDYLRKPFFPDQLLARIPIRVDSLHNEVTVRGKIHRLTPTESKLLHLLAINAGNVCTAAQIVAYVWGFGNEGDSGLIKAHIRHLRQKIEVNPGKPSYILTVPGVGYTLSRQPIEEGEVKEVLDTLRIVAV